MWVGIFNDDDGEFSHPDMETDTPQPNGMTNGVVNGDIHGEGAPPTKPPTRLPYEVYKKMAEAIVVFIQAEEAKLDGSSSELEFSTFTPNSNQFQISPAASPEILHHTVWGRLLFIALHRWKLIILLILTTSPIPKGWENVLYMYFLNLGVKGLRDDVWHNEIVLTDDGVIFACRCT